MQAGDCFFGDILGGENPHYWIVLCCTEDRVALVNITTGEGGPKAHKIGPAFFPVLQHRSELNWFDSIIVSSETIQDGLGDGQFRAETPLGAQKVETLISVGRGQGLIPREIDAFIKNAGLPPKQEVLARTR